MEEQNGKEIIELLNSAQHTTAVHQKNSILLKRLYENYEPRAFIFVLKKIFNVILSTDVVGKYFERTVDYLALFCSILKSNSIEENDDTIDYVEHPLLSEILTYLLETSSLCSDTVRFRSCLLINKILDQLVGSDVSTDLCERIEKSLLIRLQDPKNVIRQQAVIALHRLQDPTNPEDEIIRQFIHLMNSDSFSKVRQLCIENIATRKDVISHIIIRTRDVDVKVRLAAYKRLSNFAEYLKISEKRRILRCGFLDESDQIKEYISKSLISKWLDYYEGNILVLLKSVRLDADEKDIEETVTLFEYILESFFGTKFLTELTEILKLNEEKVIPFENLNWEIATYWRTYVQFLNKTESYEEELDKVLPELVHFARYVKEYYSNIRKEVTTVEFLEQQFILKQLILILKTYDFADIVNRQCLNTLVYDILEKVVLMSDVTELVVSTLENSIPNIDSRCQFVSEIISEIMYPMNPEESQRREQETEFQKSKMMVIINCLMEDQNEAIREHNYMEAERLKHEIEAAKITFKNFENTQIEMQQQVEKKTDIPTIIKYLDIAAGLLLSPQVTHLNTSLKALKNDVIEELLIHDNDNVRAKALRCYALCCIVDKECASTGIHIFSTPIFAYQSGEECDTQTLLICIGAVVDLLRIYGYQLMAAPDNEVLSESMEEQNVRVLFGGTSLTDLMQGLVDLMDDEQYEVEEKAALGLCQLVLSDRIHSPSLISRLVLKWCSPATDNGESNYLTQIIGSTLKRVPSMTDCSEQLEDAVLMTIKTLVYAPKISPLADVNIDNIAKFMIALCKTSPKGPRIQTNLAMTICLKINKKPRDLMNSILSKMLLMLDIPDDEIIIKDLLKICNNIRDDVNDRTIVNNIVKFVSSLDTKKITDDNC